MKSIVVNAEPVDILEMGGDPDLPISIIDIQTLTTRDASITKIVAKIQDDIVEATGTSKRCPEDIFDPVLGQMLSYARAYENLVRGIKRRAKGLIDHYDHVRQNDTPEARELRQVKHKLYQDYITRVASSDDAIQRAAVRVARESEGSWAKSDA